MDTTLSRRRILMIAAFFAIRPGGLKAALQPEAHAQQHEPRFRADVDVVRLSVTARDGAGRMVHDLRPEDFRVLEDGEDAGGR